MIRVFNEEMGGAYITTYDMADPRTITKTLVRTLCTSISKTATAATALRSRTEVREKSPTRMHAAKRRGPAVCCCCSVGFKSEDGIDSA